MSFTATLYECNDDAKVVNKTLENGVQVTLEPTKSCDILNPVFELRYNSSYMGKNYVVVNAPFNRSYFINDYQVFPGEKLVIYCGVDILNSYKDDIKNIIACVIRSESIGKPTDVIDVTLPIHQSQVTTTAIDLGNPIFTTNPTHGYFLTVQGTNGT